jgi:hypothetical protein
MALISIYMKLISIRTRSHKKSPGVADQLIYQHQGYSSMLTNKVHNYCLRRSRMEPFYFYSTVLP